MYSIKRVLDSRKDPMLRYVWRFGGRALQFLKNAAGFTNRKDG